MKRGGQTGICTTAAIGVGLSTAFVDAGQAGSCESIGGRGDGSGIPNLRKLHLDGEQPTSARERQEHQEGIRSREGESEIMERS